MKKILITGANGFVGSRIEQSLKGHFEIFALGKEELNIGDKEKVFQAFKQFRPHLIIHTAAIANTAACEQNPELSFHINVQGTIHVGEATQSVGARMVFLSTEQIFNGNQHPGPYDEDVLPQPNTVYGRHKWQAENELKKICENLLILRLTWLFGFPERLHPSNSNLFWNIIQHLLTHTPLSVPKNEFRGMTYIQELLENFPKLLELPSGLYHTGSENDLNTYEVAALMMQSMGLYKHLNNLIKRDEEKYKAFPRDIRISNKKLRANGINFSNTLTAVQRMIKEYGLLLSQPN